MLVRIVNFFKDLREYVVRYIYLWHEMKVSIHFTNRTFFRNLYFDFFNDTWFDHVKTKTN